MIIKWRPEIVSIGVMTIDCHERTDTVFFMFRNILDKME